MEQTQNVSDERLAEKLRYAEIAEAAYVKSGLNPEAELWGEDVSLLRELTALRASHAGLTHAVEYTLRCLEETGWDQEIHSSVPGTLRGALAEARKLEVK